MARYAAAKWEEIPENRTQSKIRPTQVILHVSAGESTDLFGYWTTPGVVLESHFYVTRAGVVEQYEDTTVMAEANLNANRRPDGTGAIAIETQGADANGQWDPAQVQAIIRLVRWLCQTHGIPARLCPGPDAPGIGWHVMWGAPGPWTPAVGKVCPGPARIQQIHQSIMPHLVGPEEDTLPSADDLWNVKRPFPVEVKDVPHNATAYGMDDWLIGTSIRVSRIDQDTSALHTKVDTLTRLVSTLTSTVAAIKVLSANGNVDIAAVAKAVVDEEARRMQT